MEVFGEVFSGGVAFKDLRDRISEVPETPGVYAISRKSDAPAAFLEVGSGGFFKGIDPNVSIAELRANWVEGANILYFGKAGGVGRDATLRSRLRQYEAFGRGVRGGHKGGRYIWQLQDAGDLLAWWRIGEDEPRQLEKELIEQFRRKFGARPFANLVG